MVAQIILTLGKVPGPVAAPTSILCNLGAWGGYVLLTVVHAKQECVHVCVRVALFVCFHLLYE